MLAFYSVLTITLTSAFASSEVDLECESYGRCHESSSCCIMRIFSETDTPEPTIFDVDNQIDGIDFSENKRIVFLPILVHETFPNLIGYYAFHCSIREISKKNFDKLSRLEDLNLNSNHIERIKSDTFEDLVSLTQLHISGVFCCVYFWLKNNVCVS